MGLPELSLSVGGQDQHLPPIELGQTLPADGAGEGRKKLKVPKVRFRRHQGYGG